MIKQFFKGMPALLLAVVMFQAPAVIAADGIAAVHSALQQRLPKVKIPKDAIRKTPVPGLYELTLGPNVYYVTKDARYLVFGSIRDLQENRDLTTASILSARIKAVNAVGEKSMIIFSPPKDKVKYTVTVFTDVDCFYCRKLHSQIEGYNKLGIRVRYLLYPRAPFNTQTYQKAVTVWCAKDRRIALTEAKQGKNMQLKSCNNPVARHKSLGRAMGVRGTPAIVRNNGQIIPGYLSPTQLIRALNRKQK